MFTKSRWNKTQSLITHQSEQIETLRRIVRGTAQVGGADPKKS